MSAYGTTSLGRLKTCHPEIVQVCFAVIPHHDHTIIWGARGEVEQNKAFFDGYSNKPWPKSKHNAELPEFSDAVDIAPWHTATPHIRWESEREFIYLAGHMMQAAAALGIKLRWGGDWDADHDLYDINKPFDLGHFERVE